MDVGAGATVVLRRGKFPGGFEDFDRGERQEKEIYRHKMLRRKNVKESNESSNCNNAYNGKSTTTSLTSPFLSVWADYVNGFGDPSKEYWLGLEAIHVLTNVLKRNKMRVDFTGPDGTTK